jgi:hypothetical protein
LFLDFCLLVNLVLGICLASWPLLTFCTRMRLALAFQYLECHQFPFEGAKWARRKLGVVGFGAGLL